jgi:hypothetical protein
MPTYYEILGVEPTATLDDIKRAHRKLARQSHPDKVPGRVFNFHDIQEAYETLSDVESRRAYDAGGHARGERIPPRYARRAVSPETLAREAAIAGYMRANLPYTLPENPERYHFYDYYNALFRLEGEARIQPGMPLDWNEIDAKLDYVSECIRVRQREFMYPSRGVTAEEKKRYSWLAKNYEAINWYQFSHFTSTGIASSQKRRLYDIYIGHYQTEEDRHIAENVGGTAAIKVAMKNDPLMSFFVPAVFLLQEMNLLTPDNFKKVTAACWYHANEWCSRAHCSRPIVNTLAMLRAVNLADQAHLDFLVQYMSTYDLARAQSIHDGVECLRDAGILTQKNLELVVHGGSRGKLVGMVLKNLQQFGLRTPETEAIAIRRIAVEMPLTRFQFGIERHPDLMHDQLLSMQRDDSLPNEKTRNLQWEPPKELNDLCVHLNEIFAYGLYLLSVKDLAKGRIAMLLALDLKADLRAFIELPSEQQRARKDAFRATFLTDLHSKDNLMSEHQAYWKVIVSNVLIAFTGIGLFAIGIQYLRSGQAFFATTKSNQLIHKVEQSNWMKGDISFSVNMVV